MYSGRGALAVSHDRETGQFSRLPGTRTEFVNHAETEASDHVHSTQPTRCLSLSTPLVELEMKTTSRCHKATPETPSVLLCHFFSEGEPSASPENVCLDVLASSYHVLSRFSADPGSLAIYDEMAPARFRCC